MSIFRHLAEKPWLTPQSAVLGRASAGDLGWAPMKLGLWVFLAVVTMLFALLIAAYGGRMTFEDWRPGPEFGLLWFNTLALLSSSVAMQWATMAARRGRLVEAGYGLMTGGLLAVIFLFGQSIAWLQLSRMGGFGVTFPAVAFFYLITGLHALHIAGGLVAWSLTAARLWGRDRPSRVRQSIELCTVYWHFMFAVWVVLFGLLFSGNNMGLVLAFCGLR